MGISKQAPRESIPSNAKHEAKGKQARRGINIVNRVSDIEHTKSNNEIAPKTKRDSGIKHTATDAVIPTKQPKSPPPNAPITKEPKKPRIATKVPTKGSKAIRGGQRSISNIPVAAKQKRATNTPPNAINDTPKIQPITAPKKPKTPKIESQRNVPPPKGKMERIKQGKLQNKRGMQEEIVKTEKRIGVRQKKELIKNIISNIYFPLHYIVLNINPYRFCFCFFSSNNPLTLILVLHRGQHAYHLLFPL
jgi:hypothetical protein